MTGFPSNKSTSVIDEAAKWLSRKLKEPVSISYRYDTIGGRSMMVSVQTSERFGHCKTHTELGEWMFNEIRRQQKLFRRF